MLETKQTRRLQTSVIFAAAKGANIPVKTMLDKTRKRRVVIARQCAMYVLWLNGLSLRLAGSRLGKDHATAVHAKNQILLLLDKKYWCVESDYTAEILESIAITLPFIKTDFRKSNPIGDCISQSSL